MRDNCLNFFSVVILFFLTSNTLAFFKAMEAPQPDNINAPKPNQSYTPPDTGGSSSGQTDESQVSSNNNSEPKAKKNSLPSAVDDFGYSVNGDSTLFGIDAKSNDFDPDGDEINIISASSTNAKVIINPDGTLDYKPKEGFQGSDRVYYKISDGKGGTAEGRVHIEVKPRPESSPENNTSDKQTGPETSDAQENSQNDENNQSESGEPKSENEESSSFFGLPFKNPFSSQRLEPAKEKVKETVKKSKDIYKETVKEIKQEIKDFGCKFVYEKYIIEKKVPKTYPSSHNWNNWSSFDIKQYEDLILGCK